MDFRINPDTTYLMINLVTVQIGADAVLLEDCSDIALIDRRRTAFSKKTIVNTALMLVRIAFRDINDQFLEMKRETCN